MSRKVQCVLEDEDIHGKYPQRHKFYINFSEHNKKKLQVKAELYFLAIRHQLKTCHLRYRSVCVIVQTA